LRRTELVALDVADVELAVDGDLRLRTARGVIAIPRGSQPHLSAGRACQRWLERSAIGDGPLFRPVDRHGNVGAVRLSDRAVTTIVQRAAESAGLTASYSGRSLRLGMVLTAAAAGASDEGIIGQTGHRSVRLVREYRRAHP
jgi:integrase